MASAEFYRSIVSGRLALGPLVAIVNVERLSLFVLALHLGAVLGGWIFHAANLVALGYGERRFALVSPAVGLAGAFAYAGPVALMPGLRPTRALAEWVSW